jgi:ribosomal protein S27E
MTKKRKEDTKYDFFDETKVKCKCGHVISFYSTTPYITCSHCGNLVFRNKKEEYNYKVKRRLGVYK